MGKLLLGNIKGPKGDPGDVPEAKEYTDLKYNQLLRMINDICDTLNIQPSGWLYRFCVVTDTHIDGDGSDWAESIEDFNKIITYCENNSIDFICHAGDATFDGRLVDLQKYKEIKEAHQGINVFVARGNHDTINEAGDIGLYKQYVEPNGLYFEKIINGDVFLFIGLTSTSMSSSFTAESLDWLEAKLVEHREKDKIFIFEHVYMPNTCGDVENVDNSALKTGSGTSNRYINLIRAYPNTIMFSGHSHLGFETEQYRQDVNLYKDETGAYAHVPSLAVPRIYNPETGTVSSKGDGSQCWIVEVYEDKVALKAYDNKANKLLPEYDKTIEFSKTEPNYVTEGLWGEYRHTYVDNANQLLLDSTENQNHLSMVNFTASSRHADGILFDRSYNNYMSIPKTPISSNEYPLTVEFYGAIDNSSSGGAVVCIGSTSTSRAYIYRIKSGYFESAGYVRSSAVQTPEILFSLNEVHHFTFVLNRDSGTTIATSKMYVDGELFFSHERAVSVIDYEPQMLVGAPYDITDFAKMKLQQLRIYNKALTEEEVKLNYQYCL